MANIKILAGDFLQGDGDFSDDVITIETPLYPWPGINIPISMVRSLNVTCENSNKEIGSSVLYGLAGGLVMGPLGAVAGFILSDNHREVTFLATLTDERQFLATTDENSFKHISQAHSKIRTIRR